MATAHSSPTSVNLALAAFYVLVINFTTSGSSPLPQP
jgi:hypothetical protein